MYLSTRYPFSDHIIPRLLLSAMITVCITVLALPPGVDAADTPDALWETFTFGSGILSGNVFDIEQDRDGALWFGTEAGAGRYNGRWSALTSQNGLPGDSVRAVVQTEDGAVWFATQAGLARRAPDGSCCDTWTTADGLPGNDLHTLSAASVSPLGGEGQGVWVGSSKGLAYIEGDRVMVDTPVPGGDIVASLADANGDIYVGVKDSGVWRRTPADGWQRIDDGKLALGARAALMLDDEDHLWVGTSDGVIYQNSSGWQRFPLKADDDGLAVFALTPDDEGGLWIGTIEGVFYAADYAEGALPIVQYRARQNGLVNDYVRVITLDQDRALWFGTIAGVSRHFGLTWQTERNPALDGQRINALLQDSAGRTWVGTELNGLSVLEAGRWQHYAATNGLPDNRVVSLYEDDGGRVWVGTYRGVGYWTADAGWKLFDAHTPGLAGLPVYDFEHDASGGLWLATESGVSRWTEADGFTAQEELIGKRVNAAFQANDGVLWFGTATEGLFRRVSERWEPMADGSTVQLKDIVVGGISDTEDGSLWVGSYNNGLWRYFDGKWTRMDSYLTSPKLLSLRATGRDLWVGSRQGLSHFDGLTWQDYNGDVLPGASVHALSPDAGGGLWIGTSLGLVHYRPDRSPPWVRVDSLNLLRAADNTFQLAGDTVEDLRFVAGDLTTRDRALVLLTQLSEVDAVPRVHTDTQVTDYRDIRLTAGKHVLQVIARDAAFNYSEPVEYTLIVPKLVRLPGGALVRSDAFYLLLGIGGFVAVTLGFTGAAGLNARARARRLAQEMAVRQREALERAFNPYVSGEPIRDTGMFFGREDLVQKIFNALHQNSIMIHGERRMGKTTLLYQLAAQLRNADDPEWAFIPVYVDLEGTPQHRFFYQLMDAIWGALQAYTTGNPPVLRFATLAPEHYTDREFAADLRVLLERVRKVVEPRKVRVILLMDEMDVVSSYDTLVQQQLRRIFMSPLAVNLGAVVAGIQISKAWDRLESPWYNLFNEIPLDPFTDERARELLIEPVRGTYEWEPDAVDFVVAQAEGRPYRLQQYALEAVNHMLNAKRLQITLEDVQAAHEILERARGTAQ